MQPLFYRPNEFDDWGQIRNADGSMFASVRRPLSEEEAAEHRRNKTDPFEDLARTLMAGVATQRHASPTQTASATAFLIAKNALANEARRIGPLTIAAMDEVFRRLRKTTFAEEGRAFNLGDRVRKTKGSSWHGRVVGFYSTTLTPIGYAIESEREPGSVQIYPQSALEPLPAKRGA